MGKNIYKLECGETVAFGKGVMTRVPGGWVYERREHGTNTKTNRAEVTSMAMIFIPWSGEFQESSLNKNEVKE